MWSSPFFNYIEISDSFCTGSSIMPQKKNPDVPELVRGKTGRVYGHLMSLLTLMESQPLAYNKDNQEDKEPVFDVIDTLEDTLEIFPEMIAELKIFPKNMQAAAMNPIALDEAGVDASIIEKEIEIAKDQLRQEGKPEAMLDNIAKGKLNRFFKDNTLVNQDYIKDSKMSVAAYVKSEGAQLTVTGFARVALV